MTCSRPLRGRSGVIDPSYSYSPGANFTGYPFTGGFTAGTDNLYRVTGAYEYWGEETTLDADGATVLERIRFTFNKFHLLTKKRTERGVSEVTEDYNYNEITDATFAQQPDNLHIPSQMVTTFGASDTDATRTVTVKMTSDSYGNVLTRTEASVGGRLG